MKTTAVNVHELTIVELSCLLPLFQWSKAPSHWNLPVRPSEMLLVSVAALIVLNGLLRRRHQPFPRVPSELLSRYMQRIICAFVFPFQIACIGYSKPPGAPATLLIVLLAVWAYVGFTYSCWQRLVLRRATSVG